MGSPGGDEDGVPQELDDGPALHAVVLQQPPPQHLVQVPALVVDRVVVRRVLLALFLPHLADRGPAQSQTGRQTDRQTGAQHRVRQAGRQTGGQGPSTESDRQAGRQGPSTESGR